MPLSTPLRRRLHAWAARFEAAYDFDTGWAGGGPGGREDGGAEAAAEARVAVAHQREGGAIFAVLQAQVLVMGDEWSVALDVRECS